MAAAGAVLFFVTLFVWVPAAWLYFDAEDRGHSAYLWGALALIPFWNVIVIVGYFIVRSRAEAQPGLEYSRARIYQHVAILTFWGLLAVALTSNLFGLIEYARADDPPPFFEQPRGTQLRETLAFAFALIFVSVPAFIVHYGFVQRRLRQSTLSPAVRHSLARLQVGLFSVLVVLGGLIATLTTVMLVFALSGRLFDVGDLDRDATTFGMSALPVALLSLALTFAAFWLDGRFQDGRALIREAEAAAAVEGPPAAVTAPAVAAGVAAPAAEAAAGARFCSQCGAELAQGSRFCASCGTAVESA